jgi:hypothetical protein
MTPGFSNATDAGYDACATYFFSFVYFRQRFHVLMAAYTALPAPCVNWGF